MNLLIIAASVASFAAAWQAPACYPIGSTVRSVVDCCSKAAHRSSNDADDCDPAPLNRTCVPYANVPKTDAALKAMAYVESAGLTAWNETQARRARQDIIARGIASRMGGLSPSPNAEQLEPVLRDVYEAADKDPVVKQLKAQAAEAAQRRDADKAALEKVRPGLAGRLPVDKGFDDPAVQAQLAPGDVEPAARTAWECMRSAQ